MDKTGDHSSPTLASVTGERRRDHTDDAKDTRVASTMVNWDLLENLVQCPACGCFPLILFDDSVACRHCELDFRIESGVIDFLGQSGAVRPRLYDNLYYERFIEHLDVVHDAHYVPGSVSVRIEGAIKQDLFRLVEHHEEPSIDLGCGLGEGFRWIGRDEQIVGVDSSMALLVRGACQDFCVRGGRLSRVGKALAVGDRELVHRLSPFHH